jgi:hypothetical protein
LNGARRLNQMDLSGEAGIAYFAEDFYAASDRSPRREVVDPSRRPVHPR